MPGGFDFFVAPNERVTVGTETIIGTIRSQNCQRLIDYGDICHHCAAIPQLKSFMTQLLRLTGSPQKTTRNQLLSRQDAISLKQYFSDKCRNLRLQNWYLKLELAKTRLRVKQHKTKCQEDVVHGDLNALLHRIGRAKESGTELDIPLSKQLIVDCARNMQCKPRGHRFTANTRGFWEVIRIYGGCVGNSPL